MGKYKITDKWGISKYQFQFGFKGSTKMENGQWFYIFVMHKANLKEQQQGKHSFVPVTTVQKEELIKL